MSAENKNLIAVIGDIHGCISTLCSLCESLKKYTQDIYTVGDIIDRGPASKEVVKYCIDNNINAVKGNHEDMLVKAIENPSHYNLYLYYFNGGQAASFSYANTYSLSDYEKFKDAVVESGHFDYLKSLPLKYEFESVLICHAGIISNGNEESILWNRDIPDKLEKLQIIGHSPNDEPVFYPGHFINIDTGCVKGNKLTAVILNRKSGDITEMIFENCSDFI